ncbi:MAG TPA: AraC family transcriptional regulator [Vicinamibacterales bacterium]|jgi:AraC-like DNA-binding protein|nr:AraC family transcriptional regulator [Vicinamibacterales bacterium]
MPLRARHGIAPWPPVMLVWGPGFVAAAHRHHCVQLLFALHGSVLVRGGRTQAWRKCGAVWIRPDANHELDARGTTLLIGFIDAESDMGAALSARIEEEIACIPARQVARWRAVLGSTPNDARAQRWLTEFLLHRRRGVAIHPAVRRVLNHLHEPQAALDDLSLKTLAGIAGLSPSRFMHAFTESVRVPVRPYILWLRLQRAACDLMDGASVTSAAHRAGFSDGAHLTRTFRRMLGATPSELALLKRLSVGFSLEPDERSDRVVRALNGAADKIESSSTTS